MNNATSKLTRSLCGALAIGAIALPSVAHARYAPYVPGPVIVQSVCGHASGHRTHGRTYSAAMFVDGSRERVTRRSTHRCNLTARAR
jgi:hypothetical protein